MPDIGEDPQAETLSLISLRSKHSETLRWTTRRNQSIWRIASSCKSLRTSCGLTRRISESLWFWLFRSCFQTKIASMGFSAVTMAQSLIFVDNHKNRWIMRMEESEFDTTMNQIIMYFPLSNTPLACKAETTPIEHLIDTTYLREKGLGIITTDVGSWFLGWW